MGKRWYEQIPHALSILFGIIVLVTLMTYIIPAGTFDRVLVDGRQRVVPGSFKIISSTPIGLLDMFKAIPLGFKTAVEIIFVVFAGGIMFGVMEKSHAVEHAIGTLVHRMGLERRKLLIVLMTLVYGFLGIAVGYENNIAMVPIAAVLSLAIGGDLLLAAGISVGAMTVGFGLSPINPYTVGTGHKIAELPMFSGAPLRSVLCFIGIAIMAYYNVWYFNRITKNNERSLGKGLDTTGFALEKPLQEYTLSPRHIAVLMTFVIGLAIMLYGIFQFGWYINELSAVFLMIALVCGCIARMGASEFSENVLASVSQAAPGAFMVGFATTIKVLMEKGNISDTISHYLSELLQGLPTYASAISMSMAQCVINLFIPSGSGQALATLPVMLPMGDVLGLTNQTTILAFQIGDGVTNLINPTVGGLIAMLAMCRVPIDRWFRYILPVVGIILLVSWIFLLIAVFTGYS